MASLTTAVAIIGSMIWAAAPVEFTLTDIHGQTKTLTDLAGPKGTLLAFIGVECPLVKLSAPKLVRLAEKYQAEGIHFVAIDPNAQDSLLEIKKFQEEHKLPFAVLLDKGGSTAQQLQIERVPTVLLLDANKELVYRGRVDDQYGFRPGLDGRKLSYQLPKPKREDLARAIDDLLASKPIQLAQTEATGCLIGKARTPDPKSKVTYSDQIVRLFNAHCVSCHRPGQIGPFALGSYEDAAGWAEMILEVVSDRRMPPWHADPAHGTFSNDARLRDEQIQLVKDWVAAGVPEGDRSQVPTPPKFPEGWLMPEPDQVIYMADKAYSVQAEGTVPYINFIVDPGWKEDKWVTAMEPRPGNPKVVHHIVMFVIPPPGRTKYYTKGLPLTVLDWFASFAPGLRPPVLPEHMGRFIPAGSKLLFQMHYTPCGTPEEDRSFIGIKFADPAKVKREVAVQHAGNMFFSIPPQVKNHQLEAWYDFSRDSVLLTVSPHMHWRGKDFKYTLHFPDGREQVVLFVPQYDFGWQTTYTLAEPIRVPKGSRLHCVAHYDNSADNLNNPNPMATVRFGEQTWDEMMYGWFEIALDDKDLDLTADAASSGGGK
jgi:peroxiredoxin/mono/diheme cytochrome c family protein